MSCLREFWTMIARLKCRPKIFLVGVDHIIQHEGFMFAQKRGAIDNFTAYLAQQIQERGITFVGEEFSEFLLHGNNVSISTVQAVAQDLHVEHRFCDPSPEERQTLGIEDDDQREEYWLQRINDRLDRNMLFVCGDSHVGTFQSRLEAIGAQVEILAPRDFP